MYHPSIFQKLLAFLLLPLSALYTLVVSAKRLMATPKAFGIPIISVGNLTLGGSGKTPLTIALAEPYERAAIILRGYKRHSKGLRVVSHWGEVACSVLESGDEAMLYATMLPHALVIVGEDRVEAIEKAKSLGANVVFLDDGFSKVEIEKFDILIRPNPKPSLPFCLPSGPYREPFWFYMYGHFVAQEGEDFSRHVTLVNPTPSMVLVTAIANPKRLEPFLPQNLVASYAYPDHYMYTKGELLLLLAKHRATSLLVTKKDAVKLHSFDLPLSILELSLEASPKLHQAVQDYIRAQHQKQEVA